MAKPRVKVPNKASKDEVITIKTLISHKMESGQRKDADGNVIGGTNLLVGSLEYERHLRGKFYGAVFVQCDQRSGIVPFRDEVADIGNRVQGLVINLDQITRLRLGGDIQRQLLDRRVVGFKVGCLGDILYLKDPVVRQHQSAGEEQGNTTR